MSKHFELWVLTRESNRGTIEPWIVLHPEFSGIHFLYFDLPKWARFYLAGKKGYTKVLNESTPQVAVNEILTFVFNEQHKKNLKREK